MILILASYRQTCSMTVLTAWVLSQPVNFYSRIE